MSIPYPPEAYLELIKSIESRYFEDCAKYDKMSADKNNATAWYGYNQHSARNTFKKFDQLKSVSIELMINKDEEVKAFYASKNKSNQGQDIFTGGRTLKRYEEKAKNGETVNVKDSIYDILKLYIQKKEADTPQNILDRIPNKENYHYFLGAYYSIRDYGVKNFLLLFSKNKNKDDQYETYEIGFHNVRGGDKGKENVLYHGSTYYEDSYIFANLTRANSQHQLNIICNTFTSEQSAMNNNITGSLQGISLSGGIVNAECYLIKLKEDFLKIFLKQRLFELPKLETILDLTNSITLSLYLWLHKSTFLVGHKKSYEIDGLAARGIKVQTYKDLKGIYRIWQYGLKEFTIVQSKFEINGDGTGWLYPPVELDRNKNTPINRMKVLEQQACSINLSNNTQKNTMAIIETYFEKLNIFNTAIFACTPAMRGNVTIGAFSTIGYYENRPNVSGKKNSRSKSFSDAITGYFVMQKDNSDFKPDILSFEQAEEIANGKGLNNMLIELINVWLSKSWDLSQKEKLKIGRLLDRLSK